MKHAIAAALFALATGCGDDGGKAAVDGPPIVHDDAPEGVDGPQEPGVATLKLVIPGGGDASGQLVEWYDPTGAAIAETTTDATGTAVAMVGPNSAVTIAIGGTQLYTTLGIQPGDTILIEGPTTTVVGTIKLTAPLQAGASTYSGEFAGEASSAPVNSVTPTTFNLDARGVDAGKYDALALALDNQGLPVAYSADLGLTAPANTTPVSHAMSAFKTDLKSAQFTLTNAPNDALGLDAQVTPVVGTRTFTSLVEADKTIDNSHTATATVKVPNAAFTKYLYAATVANTDMTSSSAMAIKLDTFSAQQAFDYTGFLPMLHGLSVSSPTAAIHVNVNADGPLTAAIGAVTSLSYMATSGEIMQIIAGPPGTSLVAPVLGAPLADYKPSVPFQPTPGVYIALGGTGLFADTAAFRQNWFPTILGNNTLGLTNGILLFSEDSP